MQSGQVFLPPRDCQSEPPAFLPSRKDTDTITLPINCDSPMFRPRPDLASRNSMFELKTSPDIPPHLTWASCANGGWSRSNSAWGGGGRLQAEPDAGREKGSGERWKERQRLRGRGYVDREDGEKDGQRGDIETSVGRKPKPVDEGTLVPTRLVLNT